MLRSVVTLLGLILLLALHPRPGHAADIRLVDSPVCQILLSGQITAGDTERLRALVRQLQERGTWQRMESTLEWRMCLDSTGGSLPEAARMAEFVFQTGIGTVLAPNAVCLSACSWVFMLGFEQGYEELFGPNRHMHYTARLGFHAPRLNLGDLQFLTRAQAEEAVAAVNDAVARILQLSNSRILGTRPAIDADLLEEAWSEQRADRFFFVDTVDKAGRWGIHVFGLTWPAEIDMIAAARACTSLTRWPAARNASLVDALGNEDIGALDLALPGPHTTILTVPGLDAGYFVNGCRVARKVRTGPLGEALVNACGVNESRDVVIGFGGNCLDQPEDQTLLGTYSAISIFPPQTRLADLTDAAKQISERAAAEQRSATDHLLHRSCWPTTLRLRITRVNEYATLRAQPGFQARILARMPLHAQVQLTGDPVLVGEAARTAACQAACRTAGTARNQPAPQVASCWLDNTLWFPASFGGEQGFVSGRFLAE